MSVRLLVTAVILNFGLNPSVVIAQDSQTKPKVTVTSAEMKQVSLTEVFTGRIEALDRVDLIARVPGFVKSINFKDGSSVKAADVLIEIEPDSYEATVTEIQGQIQAAQAAKKLADIELDRQQKLYSSGDTPEAVVQKAEAQKGEADGHVLELQGSLQNAQLNLSYTKITAPFDGRIGLTDLSAGAFVSPEGGTLLSLSSIDPIHVTFPVTEAELLEFRSRRAKASGTEPLKLQLILADGTTYGESGSIEVIDTQVQSGTDSVLVRGSFANPDGQLIDNQLVRIVVTDPTSDKSLVIPAKALQKDQSGYFVFTIGSDNKVVKKQIQLDRTEGTEAVISDGLSEGDKVITDGLQRVHAGVEVSISTPQNAPSSASGN
ncbi:efflux RND transporter periplasmic adaptor subunit [Ruegeria conchae]|uniref:efflux RND transporter periplasmic adaptor subunit n=1 Tax=Ruegeria conchae TaxID=981384 RepID=UPI00147F645D|nr:efflux RND transporter periplasmic adaptor subunit [Ruegeria conchae]UWR01943.1 efflux RND transporter periplasmic adaptor subunit [Ruegeria conchae]